MRKSLLIQTTIFSLIIIIVFFSYRFFLYEEKTKEDKVLAKIDKNTIEKKATNKVFAERVENWLNKGLNKNLSEDF